MNSLKLVLGLYDDPEMQTQKNYEIDILRNNIAVFGASMSGKTTILKTILIRIHQVLKVTEGEEIFILDFSNNLDAYKNLPYVVAYFDGSQEENVRRIFKTVEERYRQNIRELPGKSFVDVDFRQVRANSSLRHITFIVDGLNAFMSDERYSAYHEFLRTVARDGLSKGVSIIFSANDTTNGINRLLSSFHSVIALDIPKDNYMELYGKKVDKPIVSKGRGVANIGPNVYEFQAYYPYNRNDLHINDEIAVKQVMDNLLTYKDDATKGGETYNKAILYKCKSKKMKMFSGDLLKSDWGKYMGDNWDAYRAKYCNFSDFIAGLDYYTFEPIKIHLESTRSIAIYGKKSSGKTNLLSMILETAVKIPGVFFVFWEDGRRGLTRNAEPISQFLHRLVEHQDYEMFHSWDELKSFISENGYEEFYTSASMIDYNDEFTDPKDWDSEGDIPSCDEKTKHRTKLATPIINHHARQCPKRFTVFVIQSRLFYQQIPGGDRNQYISQLSNFISNEKTTAKKLFIFSDVQPIADHQINTVFNNFIDHAFLLYDILRFIHNRGHKSVFGTLDQAELKECYGKCDTGDGFYLNLELEEHTKLKFIKQE